MEAERQQLERERLMREAEERERVMRMQETKRILEEEEQRQI